MSHGVSPTVYATQLLEVAADGNPVSGTRVRIGYLSEPVEGVGKQNPFYDRLINPRSTTDERGHFELPGLPAGFVVSIDLDHPDFAITFERMRTTQDHPDFIVYPDNSRVDVADNGATVPLTKGVEFRGTVTDGEGNSIEGARVSTDWRSCATDASGQSGGASWPQSITTRRVSEGSIPRLRVGL